MPIHVYTFSRGDIVKIDGVQGRIDHLNDNELYFIPDGQKEMICYEYPIKNIKQIEQAKKCPICGSGTADYLAECDLCEIDLNRTSSARVILGH